MIRFLTAVMWLTCALGVAQAGKQDIGSFTLELPDAFQELQMQSPMPNTTVLGYTVQAAAVPKPVVMILIRANDNGPQWVNADETLVITKRLAADMLAGTARRRTDFHASDPRVIKLAGLPAVDIEWTGKANDFSTSGRIFVVIDGSTAYFFQVMGGAPSTRDMVAASEAIKKLRKKT